MNTADELELTLGVVSGETSGRNRLVALRGNEVMHHELAVGVSGGGKSRYYAGKFLQLLNQGVGCFLIDPHKDLHDLILGTLIDQGFYENPAAFNRLLVVDFSRPDRFVPFNVFKQPYESHVKARNLLEAFKRAWPSLGGGQAPQLENLLLASFFALAEAGEPITQLSRLLSVSDTAYRRRVLSTCSDPQVVAFFRERFDAVGKRAGLLSESSLRRGFMLDFSLPLRYSLGQRDNLLDFRHLMDQGVSVLVNLSGLDEETQRMIGCLLTVGIEVAALSRADMPEAQRLPYHIIIDEWSMFSSQSGTAVDRLLALARKYNVSLSVACQTSSQLSKEVIGAFQNADMIAFRLGRDDAVWAAPRLGEFDPERIKYMSGNPFRGSLHPHYMSVSEQRQELERLLQNLPRGEAVVRIGQKTTQVQTVIVPDPHCSSKALTAIENRYAEQLLTPLDLLDQSNKEQVEETSSMPMPISLEQKRRERTQRGITPRRRVPLERHESE